MATPTTLRSPASLHNSPSDSIYGIEYRPDIYKGSPCQTPEATPQKTPIKEKESDESNLSLVAQSLAVVFNSLDFSNLESQFPTPATTPKKKEKETEASEDLKPVAINLLTLFNQEEPVPVTSPFPKPNFGFNSPQSFGVSFKAAQKLKRNGDEPQSFISPPSTPKKVGIPQSPASNGYYTSEEKTVDEGGYSNVKQTPTKAKATLRLDPYSPSKGPLVKKLMSVVLSLDFSQTYQQTQIDVLGSPVSLVFGKDKELSPMAFSPIGGFLGKGCFRSAQLALALNPNTSSPNEQNWVAYNQQLLEKASDLAQAEIEQLILGRTKDLLEQYPLANGIFKYLETFYIEESGSDPTALKVSPKKYVIVSEYYNAGSLDIRMDQLKWKEVLLIMNHLIEGLFILQTKGSIFHNDIHAGNVLLMANLDNEIMEASFTDFGISCNLEDPSSVLRKCNFNIMSEQFKKLQAQKKTTNEKFVLTREIFKEDIYALGLLFKKMLARFTRHPFAELLIKMTTPRADDRINIDEVIALFEKAYPYAIFNYK